LSAYLNKKGSQPTKTNPVAAAVYPCPKKVQAGVFGAISELMYLPFFDAFFSVPALASRQRLAGATPERRK
jgi:hypothetical protein